MKLIHKTPNGQITYCPHYRLYYLEFGNLLLNLSLVELQNFCSYVKSIDFQYYEIKNKHTSNIRKLLLHVNSNNIQFALTGNEFKELRNLLTVRGKDEFVHNDELINLDMLLN